MEPKQSIDKQPLEWTLVEPERIESPALRNLVRRIQRANNEGQGQVANSNGWSNWRDTVWKQRR